MYNCICWGKLRLANLSGGGSRLVELEILNSWGCASFVNHNMDGPLYGWDREQSMLTVTTQDSDLSQVCIQISLGLRVNSVKIMDWFVVWSLVHICSRRVSEWSEKGHISWGRRLRDKGASSGYSQVYIFDFKALLWFGLIWSGLGWWQLSTCPSHGHPPW